MADGQQLIKNCAERINIRRDAQRTRSLRRRSRPSEGLFWRHISDSAYHVTAQRGGHRICRCTRFHQLGQAEVSNFDQHFIQAQTACDCTAGVSMTVGVSFYI